MTVRQIDKPDDHPDVEIPSILLTQVGLRHHLVKSSYILDDEFLKTFRQNTSLAHHIYAADAQAILKYYGHEKIVATGSVSEIARCSFRKELGKPCHHPVTPHDFARLQKMGTCQFVIKSFENWLSGIPELYNYHILDMFEWEQGHGNWLAMCQLEFDIAWKDLFTPFNSRDLLITMLSVDEKYRKRPDYRLHHELILRLWPELLTVPINPHMNKKPKKTKHFKSYIPKRIKQKIRKIFM